MCPKNHILLPAIVRDTVANLIYFARECTVTQCEMHKHEGRFNILKRLFAIDLLADKLTVLEVHVSAYLYFRFH